MFKHALEPRTFGEIVATLGEFGDAAAAARHLSGLARVPRISAIVMFMEDREAIQWDLFRPEKMAPMSGR